MSENKKLAEAIIELNEVVARLLDPETGCPWDIQQTPTSIVGNVLEESYELIEALRAEKGDDIREEAGDLLFQVVFVGQLAQARWNYGLAEIIDQVRAKMVSRHPHVFGDGPPLAEANAVLDQWQQIKRQKKKDEGLLASVPLALPALQRAHRLSERAGRAGFDWPKWTQVRAKVSEELAELDECLPQDYDRKKSSPETKERLRDELGDLLLALANLARHLGFSAEEALTRANDRFLDRFNHLEKALQTEGQRPEDVSLDRLEELWQAAKKELENK